MTIDIPENERGVIRVFAVNRAPSEMTVALGKQDKRAIASGLLRMELPDTGFELFPIADLTGVGLSGYLSEGYAVPGDQLDGKRRKLDALDGYVLLLFSEALAGKPATLSPGPEITLIGTFGEAQPDMRSAPLDSAAAQAYSGTPRQTPPTPPRGRAGSALVVAALLVLAALILWWALL